MKKLALLAAVLAVGLTVAAPALAQVSGPNFDDQESESAKIQTNTQIAVEGNNNSSCTGLLQFGQTGDLSGSQGTHQYFSGTNDVEFSGGEFEFGPESGQECEQKVQQSAAAGKAEKKAPPKEEKKVAEEKKVEKKEEVKPAPPKEEKKEEKKVAAEEKKEEKKKELPKSGGTGNASLLALGAGALLVGGGLLVRRVVR